MFDGPTAAVVVSAVVTVGGSIIVAIIKLVPGRGPASHNGNHGSGLETRVAVLETNFGNLGRSLGELRDEIHEMRKELRQMTGGGCRVRRGGSEIDPAP